MTLADCLTSLDEAIEAAAALGLDTQRAREVRETARVRLRFPGDVYVLALVGGTGVGKSSLLNALAGSRVSEAGVRRPTTSEPVAWIPEGSRADVGPLLDWLRVNHVREHAAAALPSVAVLDLPDLDSIEPANRARVDELLPRVDAVLWVSDPEKYADAVLHDSYLRRWGPSLGRQLFVLNKADRVDADQLRRVQGDIAARLERYGLRDVAVASSSAAAGEAGTAEIRQWLEAGIEAKEVIRERLAREVVLAVDGLAASAGITSDGRVAPVIEPGKRERAVEDVTQQLLRVLDLATLERHAVAATRLAARPRGGGPMGILTSLAYKASGREQQKADPEGHLKRWRSRGTLLGALEPLRRLFTDALPALPAPARPAFVGAADPARLQDRMAAALDRAIASPAGSFRPPRSRLWPLLGLAQYAVTAMLVFAVVWLVVVWLGAGVALTNTQVPVLGDVPTPALMLFAGIVAGFILARVLGVHAGWLGRRWARRLRATVADEVRSQLRDGAFTPLDTLEAARTRLGAAVTTVRRGCSQA